MQIGPRIRIGGTVGKIGGNIQKALGGPLGAATAVAGLVIGAPLITAGVKAVAGKLHTVQHDDIPDEDSSLLNHVEDLASSLPIAATVPRVTTVADDGVPAASSGSWVIITAAVISVGLLLYFVFRRK